MVVFYVSKCKKTTKLWSLVSLYQLMIERKDPTQEGFEPK